MSKKRNKIRFQLQVGVTIEKKWILEIDASFIPGLKEKLENMYDNAISVFTTIPFFNF